VYTMCASLVSTAVIAVVGIKMEQCLSSGTWLGTILRAHSRYTVLQVNTFPDVTGYI